MKRQQKKPSSQTAEKRAYDGSLKIGLLSGFLFSLFLYSEVFTT